MIFYYTNKKVTDYLKIGFLAVSMSCSSYIFAADNKPAVKIETLLKTDSSWDGTLYKSYPSGKPEITVLKIVIPPNTALDWHTHPMPNAAYVLSGTITVEKNEDGKTKTITKGQVLPEMVGALHRGYTKDEAVELIVFYAGKKGMALSKTK